MLRPIVRYGAPGLQRRPRAVTIVRRGAAPAHRRHDRHDVCGARHRTGGAAGRRAASGVRHRSQRRASAAASCITLDQSGVRRARRHAARGRGLPERARLQRHRRPAGARRRARARSHGRSRTTIEGTGLLARALQHELDHLDGAAVPRSAARHQARPDRRARSASCSAPGRW